LLPQNAGGRGWQTPLTLYKGDEGERGPRACVLRHATGQPVTLSHAQVAERDRRIADILSEGEALSRKMGTVRRRRLCGRSSPSPTAGCRGLYTCSQKKARPAATTSLLLPWVLEGPALSRRPLLSARRSSAPPHTAAGRDAQGAAGEAARRGGGPGGAQGGPRGGCVVPCRWCGGRRER
jgi:hypothetical protein